MPIPNVPLENLEALPVIYRTTVPESYLDAMGHMNVRHYLAIFDDAAWEFIQMLGMTADYYRENNAGGFALQHFIHYLAEVRVGETVAIRPRLIARSARRMHIMYFMINETRQNLAATLEVMGAHADMNTRRTSPYPPPIAEKIDLMLAEHNALDWETPLSGAIAP